MIAMMDARKGRYPMVALNLRMFADDTTVINATNSTGMLPHNDQVYYDKKVYYASEPKLVFAQFGQKQPIPQHEGDSAKFFKYSKLPRIKNHLVEGVTPAGQQATMSTIPAEVFQVGAYMVITDRLSFEAVTPKQGEFARLQGSQAGRSLNAFHRDALMAGTSKVFQPAVASNGTETEILLRSSIVSATCGMKMDTVKIAAGMLDRMDVEPFDDGYFVCVVHPDIATDLKRDPDWEEVHKYADTETIYRGEIGRISGVRFVKSTEAKIIGPGWLFGDEDNNGVCRMTLHTALDGTGSTNIFPEETISAAQAAELNARISDGETVRMYVGGKLATIASVTAGAAGTGKFVVGTAVTSVSAGALICGYGAGSDGSAVYCSLLLGKEAYGTTEVEGEGLQFLMNPPIDPLRQRSTVGWKATTGTVILAQENMVRIESGCRTFGNVAVSN